ncbi:hypothetical protein PR202_ga09891 [Eleusine coracana subsp. coracana]|uniref:F-box domain-containing protein n=1 Tax=Eleusine coracana subsp. coracana TaxID=191504 RepID=A0AAV5C3S2_ELECO|nr:hypothetical protein PR202_ga09891 [Eleusine coracana subsp. coracana]
MSPYQAGSVAGSGSQISDDILFFQILILLPVKCLVRLQSVCKSWRATIASTHFVHRHLEISRSRSSVVLVPRKYQKEPAKLGSRFVNIYSFQPGQSKTAKLIFQKKFYPSGIPMFSIPLHCDGLILIPCITGNIFVCNPATKEFVELPRGSRNVFLDHSVAFGLDTLSGTYKVARHTLSVRITTTEYSCGHEIMTIGVGKDAWGWKATMDPPYPIKARTAMCLPGFLYWSALHSEASHGHDKASLNVILRFSLRNETFTVHPNPPCRDFLSHNDALSDLGGKFMLCSLCVTLGNCHLVSERWTST